MTILSANDAGPALQAALADLGHGPVLVEQADRSIALLVSAADYRRYHRAEIDALQQLCHETSQEARALGLTDAILEDLLRDVS